MAEEHEKREKPWQHIHSSNLGYVNQLYEQYLNDPASVHEAFKDMFDRWGAPPSSIDETTPPPRQSMSGKDVSVDFRKVVAAQRLAQNIRTYGHLDADINLFEEHPPYDARLMDPAEYGLTDDDLRSIPIEVIWQESPGGIRNGLDAIQYLREIYTKTLAYEFTHVHNVEERNWLNHMVESGAVHRSLSNNDRKSLLRRLIQVEGFEKFLHRTFVGQKRFSIEGIDCLVPMIDELISMGVHDSVHHVMIGMAHRGRLNVLAHNLGKPYEIIFSEFHHSPNKDLIPSEGSVGINYGWTGDVKYHLGANKAFKEDGDVQTCLMLASNPSHLEFVNPVVEGFARAAQEDRSTPGPPEQDMMKAMPILIHGDAAFPGEGIVAETLNMSRLSGYNTGGTIHIIANNQIGFTTEHTDARSTRYPSDLAKGFEIPIVHVNADDPEACLAAVYLAYEYRSRFHKDFLIDLSGYRRFGHNEMDDPEVTQSKLYSQINAHPTVPSIYAEHLQKEEVITSEDVQEMEKKVENRLQEAYDKIRGRQEQDIQSLVPPEIVREGLPRVETGIPMETLQRINHHLLQWPQGFTIYPKLERILKRREDALEEGNQVDWALAEMLAFATILADGKAVRLTGQDSERGTFAQRHMMLYDPKTGESYSPLHILPEANASFSIHNSPLSEASVLGFEYGYNVFTTDSLVLWEAQYGDFANAAQVIIDQFLAAGRAKWGQRSSLVLLLPHGYEGQGPEHSSARLERFLQLAGENNWSVAYPTSAAQYFHILRRQANVVGKAAERPLIMMTPKSLLRNKRTGSPGQALTKGRFLTLLEQPGLGEAVDQVERLILCTGKVAIDLENEIEAHDQDWEWVHILRVEQLYPFPQHNIEKVIQRFKNLKEVIWVQEEPRNMGAWFFMQPRLRAMVSDHIPVRYIGRQERSSPAVGLPDVYTVEQDQILNEALRLEQS